MNRLIRLVVFILSISSISPHAQEQQATMTAAEFEASLNYLRGHIELPNNLAVIDVPPTFRYLSPEDSERVLVDAWGNPEGSGTLGMLFPADTSPLSENGWGVVISYDDDGHVSDDEADSINYDELLQNMREQNKEANQDRINNGYQSVNLIGWAESPFYDKSSHKMHWAKELKFGEDATNTLNYNIRVLGREGVLVLNAVANMNQLPQIKEHMKDVVAFTNFTEGNRYTDFNSSTDKIATYGLAALVGGAVAAKTGLLAKLIALLIAGKKLVVILFGAIGLWISRIFKRRKEVKVESNDRADV